ncbi:MAG: hydroxyacid dehydrogenase [Victivallales bacterium]
MKKTKVAIMVDNPGIASRDVIDYVYGPERIDRIQSLAELHPMRITSENLDSQLPEMKDIEVIFSTWGMLKLTQEQIAGMPELKAVFYAAGSANYFAGPFLERGITVCSAVEANALPVAEFCLAQILLACKGYFKNTQACRQGPWTSHGKMLFGSGAYGETVALLGVGAVSRHLLKLLNPFNLQVIAVELSDYLAKHPMEEINAMDIKRLVSIEEAFKEAYVISNHLPDKPNNKNIIKKEHFASMRHGAVFINTGRGAQVDEAGMIEVLKIRPDITVLLDVQHPEPPLAGSELYALPNVHLSSHIAGSFNDEVHRMADYMIEDFQRWQDGEELKYAVKAAELATRA